MFALNYCTEQTAPRLPCRSVSTSNFSETSCHSLIFFPGLEYAHEKNIELRGQAVTKLGLAILIMDHTVTADVYARCLRSNQAVRGVKNHTVHAVRSWLVTFVMGSEHLCLNCHMEFAGRTVTRSKRGWSKCQAQYDILEVTSLFYISLFHAVTMGYKY